MIVQYPDQLDVVWVAIDKDMRPAAFITAGSGPIPEEALSNEIVEFEEIEYELKKLPSISTARLLVEVPIPDDYVALAERGFYVYDWTDAEKTQAEKTGFYQLVAYPEVQFFLKKTEKILVYDVITRIKFPELDFSKNEYINVKKYFDCKSGVV